MKKFVYIVLLITVGGLSLFGLIALITSFDSNLIIVYTKLKAREFQLSRTIKSYRNSVSKLEVARGRFHSKRDEYDLLSTEVEKQKTLLSHSVRAVTDVRRNTGINLPWVCADDFRNAEKEMLRKIDWFKTHPLEEGWYDTLRVLSQWTINAPYVNLRPHRLMIPELNLTKGETPPYVNELHMILSFGRVAYAVQNDLDPVKATHRGILDMIELYKNLKGKGVTITMASIENYMHLATNGELLAHIDSVSQAFSYGKKTE